MVGYWGVSYSLSKYSMEQVLIEKSTVWRNEYFLTLQGVRFLGNVR